MKKDRLFTIRFTMLSDWHIGAGYGRPGSVDRLLLRDSDGLPYLPAKTVRGMWRDAAERLAVGLDEAPNGPWSKLVDVIFGDQPAQNRSATPTPPRRTALEVTPARLPAKLREKLRASTSLRAAVAFVKPGVMLDPNSGRAKDDHLRFEEIARGGAVLTAAVTFHRELVGAVADATEHMLLAATRLISRVGGKRRRGNGRCEVTVVGADVDRSIDWLDKNRIAPESSDEGPADPSVDQATANSDNWVSLPYAIQLRGPVAAAARTVGNVVASLDFLPGTYLLPHLTRVFPNLRDSVARGDLRVTNATLTVGETAGLPMPFVLAAPKGKSFADRSELKNRFFDEAASTQQLKQLRSGYVGGGLVAKDVPKELRTHNVIEDRAQRPTVEVGGVYSYEAIAEIDEGQRTVLRGVILARAGLLVDARKLNGKIRLGSSKKDDYGEAYLTVLPEASLPNPQPRQNELFVWLLSDSLFRDEALRPDPTIGGLQRTLETLLNVKLTRVMSFARARRTESWHTGWGLPRPSFIGLQAGTCVKFTVDGEITAEALASVEVSGVGERTAEGYGHVAFNHPLLTTDPAKWTNEMFASGQGSFEAATPTTELDAETAAEFAKVVEAAALKDAIRIAALAATDTVEKRKNLFGWAVETRRSNPPLSQLGGLRAALQFLRSRSDVPRVAGWLAAVEGNPRRGKKWPGDSLQRCRALIEDATAVWDKLKDHSTQLTQQDDQWAFAVRALFDAGIRAHKRETERLPEVTSGS